MNPRGLPLWGVDITLYSVELAIHDGTSWADTEVYPFSVEYDGLPWEASRSNTKVFAPEVVTALEWVSPQSPPLSLAGSG